MTRIDFHTHVGIDAQRLNYACRLARKVYAAGETLCVIADDDLLRAFDAQLWTFSALDFIPHCRAEDAHATATPIILGAHGVDASAQQILLNLGTEIPPDFVRFTRLLEVVGAEEAQLHAARARYRFYRDRGYPIHMYQYSA
ncbi:DNA polymerase III, chi subunit [Candidatus Glomeribacter gigasporarum BEG34]|uniref:DNA polymerase III, chi subunit n=1 Tax=Candidatus Glomeribacter gigasporarum BEG34 TaxID=1070319 RepID=G2J8Z7_9BURK|nr:DNA polymerase III subunit chi [Candidatus Glomeribacter gigasporarum]CCD29244.1 DNA polymerase III, chi subunit [Candidatus Glomeribacter gigasporarum BEG34]